MLTDSSLKYYRDSTAEEVRHQVLWGPWKEFGGAWWGHWSTWTIVFLL